MSRPIALTLVEKSVSAVALPPSARVKLLAALLVLCAVVAYLPAINAGFIWDDALLLTANPNMRSVEGLTNLWLGKDSCEYTPLTFTTFWLEKRVWDNNPVGYHVVNILLHSFAGVLLWRILVTLRIPGAWLGALLFVIHPVNVASVAWIAERKNTLSGVLFFAALLGFLAFYKRGKIAFYISSVALFLLAGLSKGAVATMPLALCGCILWMNRKMTRRDWVRMVPFVLIAAAVSLFTIHYQSRAADYGSLPPNFLFRLARAGAATWLYFAGIFFPIRLSPMSSQWRPDIYSPFVYLPAAAVVIMLGVFFWKRKQWSRPCLFASGYYLVMLLPVLGFFWMTLQQETLCADWWQYLAAPGIFAGIGAGFVTVSQNGLKRIRVGLNALLFVILAVLLVQTWRRGAIYQSMETYCRAVVAENPHAWTLQNNLGAMLKERGEFDEAIACERQALHDNPRFMEAHNNLANALTAKGRLEEAESELQTALQLNSSNPTVLGNLSDVYFRQGKLGAALAADAEAIKIDRYNPKRYVEFGLKLAANQQLEKAIVCLKNALVLSPRDIAIKIILTRTLIAAGRNEEASVLCGEAWNGAQQIGNKQLIETIASLRNQCRVLVHE